MGAEDPELPLSIGETLTLLQKEFPDISMSKIRFLESQGLIAPERTTSGFRKFVAKDIERLASILRLQRDQYLPLRVIREQFGLDQLERSVGGRRTKADRATRNDQPLLGLEDEKAFEIEGISPATEGSTSIRSEDLEVENPAVGRVVAYRSGSRPHTKRSELLELPCDKEDSTLDAEFLRDINKLTRSDIPSKLNLSDLVPLDSPSSPTSSSLTPGVEPLVGDSVAKGGELKKPLRKRSRQIDDSPKPSFKAEDFPEAFEIDLPVATSSDFVVDKAQKEPNGPIELVGADESPESDGEIAAVANNPQLSQSPNLIGDGSLEATSVEPVMPSAILASGDSHVSSTKRRRTPRPVGPREATTSFSNPSSEVVESNPDLSQQVEPKVRDIQIGRPLAKVQDNALQGEPIGKTPRHRVPRTNSAKAIVGALNPAAQEVPEGFLTLKGLTREAGVTEVFLTELDAFGIVKGRRHQGSLIYPRRSVELVKLCKSLSQLGFGPRHLKSIRVSVEKEYGMFEQIIATALGGSNARSKRRAKETAKILEENVDRFRSILLGDLIAQLLGDQQR